MVKRIFLLIPLLVLIISCSGFEFVYNSVSFDKIKEKTFFSISGDNKDIIKDFAGKDKIKIQSYVRYKVGEGV